MRWEDVISQAPGQSPAARRLDPLRAAPRCRLHRKVLIDIGQWSQWSPGREVSHCALHWCPSLSLLYFSYVLVFLYLLYFNQSTKFKQRRYLITKHAYLLSTQALQFLQISADVTLQKYDLPCPAAPGPGYSQHAGKSIKQPP